jgi:hypothetical protein
MIENVLCPTFKYCMFHVKTMNSSIKKTVVLSTLSILSLVIITPSMAFGQVTPQGIPFAVQNVTQSVPVPGFEQYFQIAPILPPRQDGKFYSGELSYTTNVPVEFTALQPLNETMQPQGFPVNVPGLNYTVSAPVPEEARTTDSVSFTSSGVVLLYRSPQPFTVSYSVSGQLLNPQPIPP